MSSSGTLQALSIASPCKINLHLRIERRRDDGFHDIKTLFHRVSLQDTLHLSRIGQPGIELQVSDSDEVPCGPENLAWRAAALFFEHFPQAGGISVRIDKHIPVGAGLGGGSSNAASVLLGLQRLFGIDIPNEYLVELGASLGADVAFFLAETRSAWATGIGDRLSPLADTPRLWFLIIYPQIHISTQWAYQTFSSDIVLTNSHKNTNVHDSFRTVTDLRGLLYNDFEQVVFPRYSRIETLKENLLAAGAVGALLSGSGSSVFGVFENHQACAAACRQMSGMQSSRVFTVHSL